MNATITFTEDVSTPKLPFFAKDDKNNVILVVKESSDCYGGYMVNGNAVYKPFEYDCPYWDKSKFKPFQGKITIDIP